MFYLITNRKLCGEDRFLEVISEAVEGGIDAIIVREKDLSYSELLAYAKEINKITQANKVKLIINNNIEVANEICADGFHMSYSRFVNEKIGFEGVKGVSIHSIEEGIIAQELGADYVLAGHIFPTECKKDLEPRGIEFIKELKERLIIPVIALGGITPENIMQLKGIGCNNYAVMSSVMNAIDPKKEVGKYLLAFSHIETPVF